ncbi:WYL domain-containing protein [Neoaquamicrobium sediminum]|uniref:WYL domain-containing protein n=1 Tax=Neoaquamicrobium sediminum TaxID=1849104 RepID=UPI001567098D|nr:WYL domain-containing protein [Mesorhizobium sediminum]NRC53007.1 transcriptional regulator [Mesorhizobium sediminum]
MSEENPGIRWGVEQRLEFIEFRLFWEGGVNRSDIIDMFGVSVPQASKDLSLYQEVAPGNVDYDKSAKRYIPAPRFAPRFLKPDPDTYLSRLRSLGEGLIRKEESWIAHVPPIDIALTPHRDIDTDVLRAVLTAVRDGESLEILYQSMNRERPDPVWRRITPHAFGFDGFRWHVRAYCHIDHKFKDFLLPRSLETRNPGEPGAKGADDWCWVETFDVVIAPHPELTPSQQAVVAKDYGMNDGQCVLPIRYAMLFYVLKRLGLLGDPEKQEPRRQHIVVLNKADVQSALERAESAEMITEIAEISASAQ